MYYSFMIPFSDIIESVQLIRYLEFVVHVLIFGNHFKGQPEIMKAKVAVSV
jgi:hypothetical protein